MTYLWRSALLCIISAAYQGKSKITPHVKEDFCTHRGRDLKKNPDKSKKRELSPQLSVHQEVSPRESALTGLITEETQEVPQKEKEVSTSSRK